MQVLCQGSCEKRATALWDFINGGFKCPTCYIQPCSVCFANQIFSCNLGLCSVSICLTLYCSEFIFLKTAVHLVRNQNISSLSLSLAALSSGKQCVVFTLQIHRVSDDGCVCYLALNMFPLTHRLAELTVGHIFV